MEVDGDEVASALGDAASVVVLCVRAGGELGLPLVVRLELVGVGLLVLPVLWLCEGVRSAERTAPVTSVATFALRSLAVVELRALVTIFPLSKRCRSLAGTCARHGGSDFRIFVLAREPTDEGQN